MKGIDVRQMTKLNSVFALWILAWLTHVFFLPILPLFDFETRFNILTYAFWVLLILNAIYALGLYFLNETQKTINYKKRKRVPRPEAEPDILKMILVMVGTFGGALVLISKFGYWPVFVFLCLMFGLMVWIVIDVNWTHSLSPRLKSISVYWMLFLMSYGCLVFVYLFLFSPKNSLRLGIGELIQENGQLYSVYHGGRISTSFDEFYLAFLSIGRSFSGLALMLLSGFLVEELSRFKDFFHSVKK